MASNISDTKETENKEGSELAVPESEASNMNGGDHPVTPPLQQQPSSPSAVPLETNTIPDHMGEANADSNVQVQPDPSLAQQDSPDLVPVPVDQSSPKPAIETPSNVISEPAAISDVQIVTDSKSDSPSSNNHVQAAEEATTNVKIETSSVPPESAKTETSSELPESKTNDDSNPVPTCLNEPEPLTPSPDMKLLDEKVEDDKNGGNTPEKDDKNGGNTPEKDDKNGGNTPEKDDKNGGNTPEKDDKNGGNTPELLVTPVNGNSKPEPSFCLDDVDFSDGNESGTDDEQSVFTKKLESFFKEKGMDFKPPKFYGEGLNCLKLWRAVMKLGGYDKVTSLKLWRQVGESFRPPKTCTTVSWTFRGFYEKALLDYERQKTGGGELIVPISSHSEPTKVDNQTSGSGRARRNSATRAMKGWHSGHSRNGEISDPIIKDKSSIYQQKREKQHKSLGLLKRKKPSYFDHAVRASSTKVLKTQVETAVVDIGSPADWVKINVQKTKDCFEVYALVPGLLREEVRVQSDPAGRLVISGEPGHLDNPWGVTPFKKVVSLPARIDSHQTSAVVTLHGQLFVRVPFEQS